MVYGKIVKSNGLSYILSNEGGLILLSDKDLIEKIKTDITNFKNEGNNAVLLDNLLRYLDAVQSNPEVSIEKESQPAKFEHEIKLEAYKAENDMRRFNAQIFQDSQNKLIEATILIGQNALKMTLLINGGAGVAMLAFLGSIVSKGMPINCDLVTSLSCFAFGVILSATSNGAAYLSQSLFASSFDKSKKKILDDMNNGKSSSQSTDECEAGKQDKDRGNWLRNTAIVFALLSYAGFAAGIWYARIGMLLLQNIK